jgi:dihydrodipicolinate synthase/N-acetylneuraminate lyase
VRLALTLGTAPGGVKAALTLLGTPIGPSRSPVAPLSAAKQQKMRGAWNGPACSGDEGSDAQTRPPP